MVGPKEWVETCHLEMSAKKKKADADETETAENRIACRKEDGENNIIIKDENIYILNPI